MISIFSSETFKNFIFEEVFFETVGPAWQVFGVGDFNTDGQDDILWRHQNGRVHAWMLDDQKVSQRVDFEVVSPLWQIKGVGDFNHDGQDDILWRHQNGRVHAWLLDDQKVSQRVDFGVVSPLWQIKGVGDFNHDGQDDILWQHENGRVHAWILDSQKIAQRVDFAIVDRNWQIKDIGDFNHDGRDDILWQHQNGQVGTWILGESTFPPLSSLELWERNMLEFGQQAYNRLLNVQEALNLGQLPADIDNLEDFDTPEEVAAYKFGKVYYDSGSAFSQIAAYTGDDYWNQAAQLANDFNREYIFAAAGAVPGYNNFSDGLETEYLRTQNSESRDAIALLATSASYTRFLTNDNPSDGEDPTSLWSVARSVAYGINTLLSAKRVGLFKESDNYFKTLYASLGALDDNRIIGPSIQNIATQMSDRLEELVEFSLGHLDQWFFTQDTNDNTFYIKPFMVGLTAKSLIEYVESTPEIADDIHLSNTLKDGLITMWNSAWVPSARAFRYIDRLPDDTRRMDQPAAGQSYQDLVDTTTPDLNLLIAPAYYWVYEETGNIWFRERAEEIFTAGVQPGAAFLGFNNKHFNQNYFWSFDLVEGWLSQSSESSNVPTTPLMPF